MPIGLGLGTLIAGLAAGGATAYSANRQSNANSEAAQAGSQAAVQAAQIQADAALKAAQTASDANKAAAQAQLQAAEDALAFQKAVYAQKQAQVAPYIVMGQGALGALGAGLGVQGVSQPPPAMPGGGMPPGAPPKTLGLPSSISGGNWSPTTPAAGQQPGMTLSALGASPTSGVSGYGAGGVTPPAVQPAPPTLSASTVQLRAPNGQVSDVPASLVPHYLSLGATTV